MSRARSRYLTSLVAALIAHGGLAAVAALTWTAPTYFQRSLRTLPADRVEVTLRFDEPPALRPPIRQRHPSVALPPQSPLTKLSASARVRPTPGSALDAPAFPSEPPQPHPRSPARLAPPAPTLSLSQLGIGPGVNPALTKTPRIQSHRRQRIAESNARLSASLAAGAADRDLALGLGAHGAVLSSLERTTLSGNTPATGSALFVVQVNSKGKLAFVDVIEAAGSFAGWTEVAKRTQAALAKRRLRMPAGARGVEYRIRVRSKVQMPSGRDPGLEVRALGIPLKRGEGKNSTRIDILTPKLKAEMIKVPNPGNPKETIELPSVGLSIGLFGLSGDPADIGAERKRMVSAVVESQRLL